MNEKIAAAQAEADEKATTAWRQVRDGYDAEGVVMALLALSLEVRAAALVIAEAVAETIGARE